MKKLFALLVGASLVGFTVGCSGSPTTSTAPKGSPAAGGGSDTRHNTAGGGSGDTSSHAGSPAGTPAGGGANTSSKPPSTELKIPPVGTGSKPAGEKATGSIKLDAKDVTVEKGKEATLTISVTRTSAKDDIDLTYQGLDTAGVKIEGGDKIPAGKDSVDAKVKADATAKGGEITITGTEHGASTVTSSHKVKVTVK